MVTGGPTRQLSPFIFAEYQRCRSEERTQLIRVRVELVLLQRWCEVPATRRLGHAYDVRTAPEPGPRRATSPGKNEKSDGTPTRRACRAGGIAAFAWHMLIDEPIVPGSQ
jgi:hypothetical protein